jgi:two-component system sensor histidine kinase KdpD
VRRADAPSASPRPTAALALVTVGGAGVLTVMLRALGADLATATLTLLAFAVLLAGHGTVPGVVATAVSYLAVNLCFTEPTGTVRITKAEDLVPLAAFALATISCARGGQRWDLRPVVAVVTTSVVSALLLAGDADLVVAALVLLGVVVLTALVGVPAATTAVASSYVALNYWFTPTIGSLEITKTADLAPLIAFTFAAAAAAGTVARINWLRLRAVEVEQREFAARVAQAASDNRATFLASMTHNLRTPLATIRASLSAVLAAPRGDPGAQERLLLNARAETDRLDRLVTKVLQLARIQAGALTPNTEVVELGELIGAVVRRLAYLAEERALGVAIRADDLVFTRADPDMLELVFVVMLENALRFAPPGSPIEVIVDAPSPTTARVRVVDHGPGVPAEHRDRIFEEFVRLDDAADGSGLGLTIARSMVEAHGGEMQLDETPGGGATAVVRLPMEVVAT